MGGADPVDPHRFQHFELTLERASVDSGAEAAEIVVITHSVDLHPLAVEEKSSLAIEIELTDAKVSFVTVNFFCSCFHPRDCLVKIWVFD